MRRNYFVFLRTFLLIALAAGVICGQDPAETQEVIRVDTELVDVPVFVADKTGRAITGLTQKDFSILENGVPQEIAEFSTASVPFEIALFLDTSGSTRSEIELIRRAASQFIAALKPGDRVAIVALRTEIEGSRAFAAPEVLTGFTTDREVLKEALERVATSNGTPYYDSLIRIAETVFKDQTQGGLRGRRALVALTDGVDSTSASGFGEAEELIAEAGISTYFIKVNTRPFFEDNLLGDCQSALRFSAAQIRRYYAQFRGARDMERTYDFCQLGDFEKLAISKRLYELADNEMTRLSRTSGGRVYPIETLEDARIAFREVAAEIGTLYSLRYYPTNEARDGKFRSITVRVKGLPAGAQIRAREGYTARSN